MYTVSGPLYLPDTTNNVVYPIIDNIHVPTHFFKAYLFVQPCGETKREGYVVSNDVRQTEVLVKQCWEVEKAAGFHLFDKASVGRDRVRAFR